MIINIKNFVNFTKKTMWSHKKNKKNQPAKV